MLEFKMKQSNNNNNWQQTFIGIREPEELNFKNCDYRINGIMYTQYTEEFNEVALKIKMWEQLRR